MSPAPAPQRGGRSALDVPAGESAPPAAAARAGEEPGAGAAPQLGAASGTAEERGAGGSGGESGSGARRGPRWARIAARCAPVVLAAAAMAALGIWGLARDSSMGNDEVATRWAALLSLRQLGRLVNHIDAVHGLYYLAMHAWMAVGTSPAVMRIPSVIAMTAAAAMIVQIGRRLTGSAWAGLFAGLIMALTPAISYYAQTARSYAWVFACVVAATLALLRALDAEQAPAAGTGARLARRWLAYGGLVTLAGYLNELSLLVLAAHAVTVLLARYGWRAVARWAATAVSAAVLVIPLVVISHREDAAVAWIRRPGPRDVLVLFHQYFGMSTIIAVLLAGCAAIALLPARVADNAGGAGGAGGGWSRRGVSLPSLALPLLVVPAGLLLAESMVAQPFFVNRYVLFGEAGAALLAGAGARRIGRMLGRMLGSKRGRAELGAPAMRRALVCVPGLIVVVCTLLVQLGPQHYLRTPRSRLFDFGGPARFVAARAEPGDGVLFFNAFYRKARLGYPRDYRDLNDFALAESPEQTGDFNGVDAPFPTTHQLMLTYQRIWVVGWRPSAQLPAGAVRGESVVLLKRFTLVAHHRFRGVMVTLWARS